MFIEHLKHDAQINSLVLNLLSMVSEFSTTCIYYPIALNLLLEKIFEVILYTFFYSLNILKHFLALGWGSQ